MPMAPFVDVNYSGRISAIRAVGIALTAGNANIPNSTASNGDIHCLYWINRLRVQQALPALPGLDYTGFEGALNVLAAKVP
jgi:hypothetical protein